MDKTYLKDLKKTLPIFLWLKKDPLSNLEHGLSVTKKTTDCLKTKHNMESILLTLMSQWWLIEKKVL